MVECLERKGGMGNSSLGVAISVPSRAPGACVTVSEAHNPKTAAFQRDQLPNRFPGAVSSANDWCREKKGAEGLMVVTSALGADAESTTLDHGEFHAFGASGQVR